MENPFWFYGKFFVLLAIVSGMVVFHYATHGFDDARKSHVWQIAGARSERGADLIRSYGCSSCHAISGINSRPIVGPNLERLPEKLYLAGTLANTPPNLIHWIQHPEQVRPGTAMPNLNVGDEDARDIAAYLLEHSR